MGFTCFWPECNGFSEVGSLWCDLHGTAILQERIKRNSLSLKELESPAREDVVQEEKEKLSRMTNICRNKNR